MQPKITHSWQPTYQEALDIQQHLRQNLVLNTPLEKTSLIAGADVSYDKISDLH